MKNLREQIYLAGLLHDIGKFYQRADEKLLKDYSEGHLNKIKRFICPENESGKFGYQHAWWTYKFFEDHKDVFDNIKERGINVFKTLLDGETDQNNLVNLAIYHHYPKSDLQKIVQLADWWSSGMERTPDNMEKEEDDRYGKFKYKKVRLKNLLSLVNRGSNSSTFPLAELDISKKIIEKNREPENLKQQTNSEATESYTDLWQKFESQLENLPTDSVKGFIESLLFLLQKFTWCIPASTNDLAHISLYEHLKTTAAIALALYDYQQETGCTYTDLKSNEEVLPLLLSCWDISGIQKFIYNVSGRKAAVSLKGRSFYLQLVIEMIKQKVLDHPDIKGFSGQIIYSSGGKMFLLLPNISRCRKALQDIHTEIEKIIWEEHKDQLYVNHGFIEFRCITYKQGEVSYRAGDKLFVQKNVGDLWGAVIESAAANKYRKYLSLFDGKINFEEQGGWSKNHEVCIVTGQEGIKNKDLVILDKKEGETEEYWVMRSVKAQIDLGDGVKDINCLVVNTDKEGNVYLNNRVSEEGSQITIPGTALHYYILKDEKEGKIDKQIISSVDNCFIRKLNETDFENIVSLKGNNNTYGFQFYGGNKQAQTIDKKGKLRNKTFEELCWIKETEESKGTFLGVLRMDIDGLGKIFKEGLEPKMRSFAAYSTLSAQLDWFFSGYLNTIRNDDEFNNTINIIYSGGDDVFAVGRWDKIILFAEKIRSDFRDYTGGREDVSISAGISIVGAKYPIRLAASEAGEAEDQSKDFVSDDTSIPAKNAITFFGQTISWKKEYNEVKGIRDEFYKHCNKKNKPLSKALLHQVMQWKILKDEFEKSKSDRASPSFKWHTAYYLKRYLDRYKFEDDKDVRDFIKKLQTALMCGESIYTNNKYGLRMYDLVALGARWAEMELKEFNNDKNLSNE